MNKKLIMLIVLSIFCMYLNANAQSESVKDTTISMQIECQHDNKFRFRIYNNTQWAIAALTGSFYMSFGADNNPNKPRTITSKDGHALLTLPNNREINSIFYNIETEKVSGKNTNITLESNAGDSFNYSWIAPKDSIIFSIPKEKLSSASEVFVNFQYEWENSEEKNVFTNEPEHRLSVRDFKIINENLKSCE